MIEPKTTATKVKVIQEAKQNQSQGNKVIHVEPAKETSGEKCVSSETGQPVISITSASEVDTSLAVEKLASHIVGMMTGGTPVAPPRTKRLEKATAKTTSIPERVSENGAASDPAKTTVVTVAAVRTGKSKVAVQNVHVKPSRPPPPKKAVKPVRPPPPSTKTVVAGFNVQVKRGPHSEKCARPTVPEVPAANMTDTPSTMDTTVNSNSIETKAPSSTPTSTAPSNTTVTTVANTTASSHMINTKNTVVTSESRVESSINTDKKTATVVNVNSGVKMPQHGKASAKTAVNIARPNAKSKPEVTKTVAPGLQAKIHLIENSLQSRTKPNSRPSSKTRITPTSHGATNAGVSNVGTANTGASNTDASSKGATESSEVGNEERARLANYQGPIISDAFEELRQQQQQLQQAAERPRPRVRSARSMRKKTRPTSAKRSAKKPQKKVAEDAVRIVRTANGKKRGLKKARENQKLSEQPHGFISGDGWLMETEAVQNITVADSSSDEESEITQVQQLRRSPKQAAVQLPGAIAEHPTEDNSDLRRQSLNSTFVITPRENEPDGGSSMQPIWEKEMRLRAHSPTNLTTAAPQTARTISNFAKSSRSPTLIPVALMSVSSPRSSRSPRASPARSPYASPARSPYASPARSPYASPARSPYTSPARSPDVSPARSPAVSNAGSPTRKLQRCQAFRSGPPSTLVQGSPGGNIRRERPQQIGKPVHKATDMPDSETVQDMDIEIEDIVVKSTVRGRSKEPDLDPEVDEAIDEILKNTPSLTMSLKSGMSSRRPSQDDVEQLCSNWASRTFQEVTITLCLY